MNLHPTGAALALLALSLSVSSALHAQVASPKVIIANTTPSAEIGLDSAAAVQFLANGDIQINCRLTGNACVTQNLGSGPNNPNAPTGVVLTRSPGTSPISTSTPLTLSWSSSVNTDVCFASAPSGVSGWSGELPRTGSRVLNSLLAGTYTFQLRCYNDAGSTLASAAAVTVEGVVIPQPGNFCSEYYDGSTRPMPTGANFIAHGHERLDVAFAQIWSTPVGSPSDRRALPGPFLNPSGNRYIAIPFVITSDVGSASQMRLEFIEAAGLDGVQTGSVTATISPCPGDFRPAVTGSSDAYLSFQCRKGYGSVFSLNSTSVSSQTGCFAPVGKQLYINISTHNMYGTTPGASSCAAGACGSSVRNL